MRIIATFIMLWIITLLFLQEEINALERRIAALEKRVAVIEKIADVEAQP